MKLVDIHTHQIKKGDDIQIENIFAQDLPEMKGQMYYSAGLHPWHIEHVNAEQCFESIALATKQSNMLAIGECGLDRSISADFNIQKQYFLEQIKIAKRSSKPLIIHCVRAYSDLIQMKKEIPTDIPWIIHDYRGNHQITQELIRHGFNFSLSGKILMDESKQFVLQMIPLKQLFFETDELELSVGDNYSLAAKWLNLENSVLIETIFNNFKNVFRLPKCQ